MRTRSPRRPDSGHALFGGTGWLFADLMVAIAMAFLVATTVGFPPIPQAHHTAHHSKKPVAQPLPALNFRYITIEFQVNATDLMRNGSASQSVVRAQISGNPELAARCTGKLSTGCVGLALLFGGGGDFGTATTFDNAVWKILKGELGPETRLFQVAVPRDFWNVDGPTSQFELQIYVFRNSG
jgi:hypothetical protein